MPSNEYLLVMTACIDPSAGHYRIDRADPAIRLLDYQQALRFWLSYPDPRTRRTAVHCLTGLTDANARRR